MNEEKKGKEEERRERRKKRGKKEKSMYQRSVFSFEITEAILNRHASFFDSRLINASRHAENAR